MYSRRLLLIFLCSLAITVQSSAQLGLRGMLPEDYYRFIFVSDPQLSPNGEQVAFVRTHVSEDRQKRESNIWIVSTDGSTKPIQFTNGTADRSPRWSLGGSKLAFLGKRNKLTRVYIMSATGGEALSITPFDTTISAFEWAPDGSKMLLQMRTATDSTVAYPARTLKGPNLTQVTAALYVSNGSGYLDNKRSHFWMLDLGTGSRSALTQGDAWNDGNPSFSPNGQWVAFDADHGGEEYDGGTNDDIWLIRTDGTSEYQLTDHPDRDSAPKWSPDGRLLVYRRIDRPFAQPDLFLVPIEGGEPRRLTETFDRIPREVQWTPDGKHLYITADDQGAHRVFRLDLTDGTTERLFDAEVTMRGLQISDDGSRLVFTSEDETRLPEIWTANSDGSGVRQLTFFNVSFLDSLALQSLETVTFTNDKGFGVEGFLIKPVGWEKDGSYPLVLNIKGGPGGMWGHLWFQEFQMLAAQGYAVGFVNYRGSTGYGYAHQNAIRMDYGGADYEDNMQFVDVLLDRYQWLDSDRLLVTGGSHGGYLTNWVISQTDRFKVAVTQRSVSNWVSVNSGSTFTPRAVDLEFGGSIWENYDYYWDRSPIKYADRIKTPTLIIHSEKDFICPLGQAEELFFALKHHNVPTELIIFHGESHELSRSGKPLNLVERLKRMVDWFQRYVPGG